MKKNFFEFLAESEGSVSQLTTARSKKLKKNLSMSYSSFKIHFSFGGVANRDIIVIQEVHACTDKKY